MFLYHPQKCCLHVVELQDIAAAKTVKQNLVFWTIKDWEMGE